MHLITLKQMLKDAICCATLTTLSQHPNEHYYYLALITSPEALPPCLAIWTEEALQRESHNNEEVAYFLKWSYADSPYTIYDSAGFADLQAPFLALSSLEERLALMTSALQELDNDGFFSQHFDRQALLLNVELVPPDPSNTTRAIALNPSNSTILPIWIAEVCEEG